MHFVNIVAIYVPLYLVLFLTDFLSCYMCICHVYWALFFQRNITFFFKDMYEPIIASSVRIPCNIYQSQNILITSRFNLNNEHLYIFIYLYRANLR